MLRPISENNTFCNAVIPKELDEFLRFEAARLKMTRSKLVKTILADFAAKAKNEVANQTEVISFEPLEVENGN